MGDQINFKVFWEHSPPTSYEWLGSEHMTTQLPHQLLKSTDRSSNSTRQSPVQATVVALACVRAGGRREGGCVCVEAGGEEEDGEEGREGDEMRIRLLGFV